MEKFRWCFIGAGKLANQVAAQIIKSGRHEIVSVYTRRPEAGLAFAEKFGATAYNTAAEAIADKRVDCVYIVTPHSSHFQYAEQALNLDKPVLCEKAFTIEAEDTDKLIALAKQRGVYLAEAMWTWFGEAPYMVKRWIDDGEIGRITKARLTYHLRSVNYAPRVSDPKRGGGALLDIGVYPITYLYRLFGYPKKIVCTGKLAGGIDLGEELELVFENGCRAEVSVSIEDLKGLENLRIDGELGHIKSPFYHFLHRATMKKTDGRRVVFNGKGGYVREFDTVADEIREGLLESRMVPLQATKDVMHIMDECRRQMGLVYDIE